MSMKQLSLFERDRALVRVESKANRTCPNFTDRACTFVEQYLRRHGEASSEVVTNACRSAGIIPHDDRAFGAVYMRLSRAGVIVKTGQCIRKKGHGTAGGNIWSIVHDRMHPHF